jgi:hypothetical protein
MISKSIRAYAAWAALLSLAITLATIISYAIGRTVYSGELEYFNLPEGFFPIDTQYAIFLGFFSSVEMLKWLFLWALAMLAFIFGTTLFMVPLAHPSKKINIKILQFTEKLNSIISTKEYLQFNIKAIKNIGQCIVIGCAGLIIWLILASMLISIYHSGKNYIRDREKAWKAVFQKLALCQIDKDNCNDLPTDGLYTLTVIQGDTKQKYIGYIFKGNSSHIAFYTQEAGMIIRPSNQVNLDSYRLPA